MMGSDLEPRGSFGARRPGSPWACVMAAILFTGMLTSAAQAEEALPDNIGEPRVQPETEETHPIFSASSHWVMNLLIASGGLCLAAAVIGPIVRAEAPDAVPAAMSHEEDPAADRH